MKLIYGMNPIQLDYLMANKYRGKVDNAKNRKINFELTYSQYKRIMLRPRCAYTGVQMTMHKTDSPTGTDVTLERIDNSKGYTIDNCVAICFNANTVKSMFECQTSKIDVETAIKMFASIDRLQKKQKS